MALWQTSSDQLLSSRRTCKKVLTLGRGVTSNWAFGRRVLKMVYEKVKGTALPPTSLLFEGATYDLGWDGQRTGGMTIDTSSLPTSDFALYVSLGLRRQKLT